MSERPVLLLWGESDYLVRLAAAEAFGDVRPAEIDAEEWRPGATSDLATPSLFGERRGLLVTSAQALDADAVTEIAGYAGSAGGDAILVLAAIVGSRAKAPPARLAKPLKDVAETRRVAVDRRDLPGWLAGRAKTRGVAATPPGLAELVEILGEDPATLDQALAQIGSAFPEDGVTPRTVTDQFRGFGDHRIYELCDAAFARDQATAHRYLRSMLEAREEPLAILGGIASRLRDLLRVRSLPERMPPAQLAREAGLRFDWQARRYREQARRFTPEHLTRLHARVVEADQALKVGASGDVVLSMVVAGIAGGER
jgi:DNA polymerase-3 subunit delta